MVRPVRCDELRRRKTLVREHHVLGFDRIIMVIPFSKPKPLWTAAVFATPAKILDILRFRIGSPFEKGD
jgi:hypothetical protein